MPFTIGRLFHPTMVVADLGAAERWLRDVFAVDAIPGAYHAGAQRSASFALVGDVFIELIAPQPESDTSLRRFLDRRGPSWHSLAWYVDGIGSLYERLAHRGLRLFSADFTEATDGPQLSGPVGTPDEVAADIWLGERNYEIYTHPKQTPGMHEFAEPRPQWIGYWAENYDRRLQPGWAALPASESPVALTGLAHISMRVGDPDAAAGFFTEGCDATWLAGDPRAVRMGFDTTIELLPHREGPAGTAEVESLVLNVTDLARTAAHLGEVGVGYERVGDRLVTGADEPFARLEFTARPARQAGW